MKHEIVFNIDTSQKIIIELETSLADIHCCSEAPIFFLENDKKYLLACDSVRFKLELFRGHLSYVLANKLTIHESLKLHEPIMKDIGYIFNEYWQGKQAEKDANGVWIGDKYRLWGKEAIIWLYNNDLGEIVFEVTPVFPGKRMFSWDREKKSFSQEEVSHSLQYEEWIKNYSPIVMRTIPRETAQQWLDQANKILATIEKNIMRMRAEGKF